MTKAAKRLFECYPSSDYDNPKEALAQMVTVLSGYSLGIVKFVTSPENGLQRTCKFPPRIAEIVEACNAAAARLERANRFSSWGKRQLEAPKGPRPSMEELKARFGGSLLPADFGTTPLPNEVAAPSNQAKVYMDGIRARIAEEKRRAAEFNREAEARSYEESYLG